MNSKLRTGRLLTHMEQTAQPYNPANRVIDERQLRELLARFGVDQPPKDINIFRRAFVHRSYCTRKNDTFISGNANCPPDCLPLQEESSERLEFLGDAVLGLITAAYLHERYETENEGFLTRIRTKLVNGTTLGGFASQLKFDRFIILSKQIEESGGRQNKNLLEDCFEAFIGAMYVDMGFQVAYAWTIGFLEDTIDFSELIRTRTNLKDALFKHFQHKHGEIPQIVELPSSAPNTCTICIRDRNSNTIGVGRGTTKKDAEAAAIAAAIDYCGVPID